MNTSRSDQHDDRCDLFRYINTQRLPKTQATAFFSQGAGVIDARRLLAYSSALIFGSATLTLLKGYFSVPRLSTERRMYILHLFQRQRDVYATTTSMILTKHTYIHYKYTCTTRKATPNRPQCLIKEFFRCL